MMLALSTNTRIFVCADATDMRKGFQGLSGLVAEHFPVELLSGHLFLFFNRSRDRIKVLYWDRDGLALWCKDRKRAVFNCRATRHGAVRSKSITRNCRCCWRASTWRR